MKPSSKRQKGKRLELKVAKLIRDVLGLRAYRAPLSGGTQVFKGDIVCQDLPFYWELKNQERVKFWEWVQSIRDKKNPILVISGNNRPIWAALPFEDLLKLIDLYITYRTAFKNIKREN